MARSVAQKFWISDLMDFPAAALEQDDADGGNEAFSDDDGPEDAAGVHTGGNRQEVGKRNFQEPEAEEIHNAGRDSVAGAVDGLDLNHPLSIPSLSQAHNPQQSNSQ